MPCPASQRLAPLNSFFSCAGPNLHDVVGHGFVRKRSPDFHRFGSASQAPFDAAMLHLHRMEPQQRHQGFVRQQHIVHRQLALHAAHAAHDGHQDELDEEVQSSLSVVRVQLLKQMPGAYLANVLEQLIEERCFLPSRRRDSPSASRRSPSVEHAGSMGVSNATRHLSGVA
jgi:hypothetical protein